MLVALEHGDTPVCEMLLQNDPVSGVAFLPAVSVRFALEPQELRLQYQSGRVFYGPESRAVAGLPPAVENAVNGYQKTADLFQPKPENPGGKSFNEIA